MIPFRFLSRRVLLWRLILATFIFFLVLNAVYFYTERKEQKLDSQSYAVIEELIKSKVRTKYPQPTEKILLLSYSEKGSNISRNILSNHPEIWFWQPYSLKLVSKQHATLDLVLRQANLLTKRAFDCNLSVEQMTGIEATSLAFKCQPPGVTKSNHELTICLNQMCRERRLKVVSIRDLTLNELFDVIQVNKFRMKIVLIQEVPKKNSQESEKEYRHLCHHLISDVQRAAELDGLYPGIRKIYFVDEFQEKWSDSVSNLLTFLNVSQKSIPELEWDKSRNLEGDSDLQQTSQWKKMYQKCVKKKKSVDEITESKDLP